MLGVIFSAQGKRIDPSKIKSIQEFGPIDTLKKVQTFLGMLAFVSSFIPHFSTACYPLYALLKDQKNKKFTLTVEAQEAYEMLKKTLSDQTILYHPNFEKYFYLMVDASNVGCGAFLYQLDVYENSEEGKNLMLEKLGFIPEQNSTKFLIPGVSPGKKTPVVTNFMRDTEENVSKYDLFDTLNTEQTMTEKCNALQNKVFHVRPVSWFSRCFRGNLLCLLREIIARVDEEGGYLCVGVPKYMLGLNLS